MKFFKHIGLFGMLAFCSGRIVAKASFAEVQNLAQQLIVSKGSIGFFELPNFNLNKLPKPIRSAFKTLSITDLQLSANAKTQEAIIRGTSTLANQNINVLFRIAPKMAEKQLIVPEKKPIDPSGSVPGSLEAFTALGVRPGATWFNVLGVAHTASIQEISRAYHKLALKWHPDKYKPTQNVPKEVAQEVFTIVLNAKEIGQAIKERDEAKIPVETVKTPELTGDPVQKEIKKSLFNALQDYNITFVLDLPDGFSWKKVSEWFAAIDFMKVRQSRFIVSQVDYIDTVYGPIRAGLNISLNVSPGDAIINPLARLVEKMPGPVKFDIATGFQVTGFVPPQIAGTELTLALPGEIRFGLKGKTYARTTPLSLELEIISPTPNGINAQISGGLLFTVPGQQPITLSLTMFARVDGTFGLTGYWGGLYDYGVFLKQLKLPVIPFKIGNIFISASLNLPQAIETFGLVPINSLGMGGQIALGEKLIGGRFCFAESQAGDLDILLNGYFDGGISINGVAGVFTKVVNFGARVAGREFDLGTFTKGKIPNIALERANFYVAPVPKKMKCGPKAFDPGFEISGVGTLLGVRLALDFGLMLKDLTPVGIKGLGQIDPFTLGPLRISGIDGTSPATMHVILAKKEAAADALEAIGASETIATLDQTLAIEGPQDAPAARIPWTAQMMMDGLLSLSLPAGTFSAGVKADIKPEKMALRAEGKITDLFGAKFNGNIDLKKPLTSKVEIDLTADGLREFVQRFNEVVQPQLVQSGEDLDKKVRKARDTIGKTKDRIKRLEEKIRTADKEKEKYETQKRKCTRAKGLNKIRACSKAAGMKVKYLEKRTEAEIAKGLMRSLEKTLSFAETVVKTGGKAGSFSLMVGGKVVDVGTDVIDAFLNKGINPKRIYISAQLDKVRSTAFKFEGTVAGAEVKLDISLKDLKKSALSLLKAAASATKQKLK